MAIDISDSSLEVVQCSGVANAKQVKLKGYNRTSLEPNTISGGRILKQEKFVEALRTLLTKPSKGTIDGKTVILSIPDHQCYHVTVSVEGTLGSLNLQRVQKALIGHIPFELKDMYFDWKHVLDAKTHQYIYACAAQKSVIDEYKKAFKTLGLRIAVIEPQSVSAKRLFFARLEKIDPSIIIDIGAREISVSTIDEMGVHQSSVIETGTDIWEALIAKKLKTNKQTARKILFTIGARAVKDPKVKVVHAVIKQVLQLIQEELESHVQFYQVQQHKEQSFVKKLYCIGGGGAIPHLPELIAKQTKLELHPLESSIQFQPVVSPKELLTYGNALGAALRGLYGADATKRTVDLLHTKAMVIREKTSFWKRFS